MSSILVVGGAGDYLDVADTVLLLDNYTVIDVTQRAKEIASARPASIPSLPPLVGSLLQYGSSSATRVSFDVQGKLMFSYPH